MLIRVTTMKARFGLERRKSVNPEAVKTIIGINPAIRV